MSRNPNSLLSSLLYAPARRVLAALALLALALPAFAAEDFLPPEQAFRLAVSEAADGRVQLRWDIAPGYYLYRDRIAASAEGQAMPLALPAGETKDDPSFGTVQVFHDEVAAELPAAGQRSIELTWQGCADAGLCYPPQTKTLSLGGAASSQSGADLASASTSSAASTSEPDAAATRSSTAPWLAAAAPATAAPAAAAAADAAVDAAGSDSALARVLGERSLAYTLPLFLLLGIALAFTPCVLPMLPIVAGIVVGKGASTRRSLGLSFAFVLPMALTYAALGVAAALAGTNVQAALQNRWTILGLGGVYVVLALGMFGVFTLQLPAALRERLDGASRRQAGGSVRGAAAMGVLSALLVGPCMTAPLAGILVYIAQGGNVAEGGLLLLALGLGMGVPLLVAGTAGARFLPRPGPWMERVKGLLGFALLATAAWTVQRALPAPLGLAAWGALAIVAAVTLHHLAAAPRAAAGHPAQGVLARAGALLTLLWGSAMLLGAASGASDPWRPLAGLAASTTVSASVGAQATPSTQGTAAAPRFVTVTSPQALQAQLDAARARGQPALVDFYAEWCISCKEIEETVFTDPRVGRALENVVLVRADVTDSGEFQRTLLRERAVLGPPTVLWFDTGGTERRDARLVGEFGVEELLQRRAAIEGARS